MNFWHVQVIGLAHPNRSGKYLTLSSILNIIKKWHEIQNLSKGWGASTGSIQTSSACSTSISWIPRTHLRRGAFCMKSVIWMNLLQRRSGKTLTSMKVTWAGSSISLQSKVWSKKTPSAKDGRLHIILLTEKGKKEFSKLNDNSNKLISQLTGKLSEKERAELVSMMEGIRELLSSDWSSTHPAVYFKNTSLVE